MLKRLAAGLVGLALVASPAAAGNISGWYAGIYAGGSSPGDIDFGFDNIAAFLNGPGVIESPSSFVNEGVDPVLFDFLNQGLENFPFADLGAATASLIDGKLDLLESFTFGGAVGYGFGNGVRVQADVSAASFASGNF